jgi:hypothetical protein
MITGKPNPEFMNSVFQQICIRTRQGRAHLLQQGQKTQNLNLVFRITFVDKLSNRTGVQLLVTVDNMPPAIQKRPPIAFQNKIISPEPGGLILKPAVFLKHFHVAEHNRFVF